jgi:hypothetical protein
MSRITEDLSVLTGIPLTTLEQLFDKINVCINDNVHEAQISDEQIAEIDLVIGTLCILVDKNEIKYKFIPSKKLHKSVRATILEGDNTLDRIIESSLVSKITKTYKEFL